MCDMADMKKKGGKAMAYAAKAMKKKGKGDKAMPSFLKGGKPLTKGK